MSNAINVEILQMLEDQLGKEGGRKLANALEKAFDEIDKKIEASSLQKKLELKDELTKELATKEDIARLEGMIKSEVARLDGKLESEVGRLEGMIKSEVAKLEGMIKSEIAKIEGEIKTSRVHFERMLAIWFISLLFTMIFLNQNALEFIFRVLGLLK